MAPDGKIPVNSARTITTYHCICAQLLLASTQSITSLPTRSSPDRSSILRLPAASHAPEDLSEYATLFGTVLDRDAVVIRGEEGFEKRYLQRCGRCKVVVGYMLDWGQFGDADGGGKVGRREDVVYLLPGGMVTTEEMAEGKDMGAGLELGR
jgi:hypothetical protein